MFSLFQSLPAKINARFIEEGNGSSSWNDAAAKWGHVVSDLDSQLDEVNYLSRESSNVMDAKTGNATLAKLSELRSEISALKSSATQMQQGADEIASAYETAKNSIYTSEEIDRVERKMQALDNATGIMGAVRKFVSRDSVSDLNAELVEMTRHNGEVLDAYGAALTGAFPESFGQGGETGHGGGIDSIGGSAYTHVSSAGGYGGGVSYAGGGGGYSTSASGAGYGSASFGGGVFGGTPARYGATRRKAANIPGVSEDDLIDINKYLSQLTDSSYTPKTFSGPRGTGFALGDLNKHLVDSPLGKYGSSDLGTGLSFYKSAPGLGGFDGGFNKSTFAPFSTSTPASFDKSGSSISSAGLGATAGLSPMSGGSKSAYGSDSKVAGTRLSNASARTPFLGLPGGLPGMSRFAGAGSMNPGAFRGSGVAGSVNALTGGLGMGAASPTASPSTGFGGVQTTSAAQTPGRPMMPGMMPPMGAGGAGSRKGDQQSKQAVQSSDTNILADINAFGTQRSEGVSAEDARDGRGQEFVPMR